MPSSLLLPCYVWTRFLIGFLYFTLRRIIYDVKEEWNTGRAGPVLLVWVKLFLARFARSTVRLTQKMRVEG